MIILFWHKKSVTANIRRFTFLTVTDIFIKTLLLLAVFKRVLDILILQAMEGTKNQKAVKPHSPQGIQ